MRNPPNYISIAKMEDTDPPHPPTNKGGFKGKRVKGRALSRHQTKGTGNKKQRKLVQPPQDDPADGSTASSTQRLPSESTIYTKTSKKEYYDLFVSCQRDLDAARLEIDKRDKIIDRLNTKVYQLTDATLKSRSVAREAKELAKNVEQDNKKASKMIVVQAATAEEKLLQAKKDQEVEMDRVRAKEEVSLVNYCTHQLHRQYC